MFFILFSIITPFAANAGSIKEAVKGKNILVVYFSLTGTTEKIANEIHRQVGGDIQSISVVTPYPQDYHATVARAKQEITTQHYPEINPLPALDHYDVIFIGYPIWWNTLASPVQRYLTRYHVNDKLVIPFCSDKMSGFGFSLRDLVRLTPGARYMSGLAVDDDDIAQVAELVAKWLAAEKT
jgi:flavodoxin